MAGIEVHVLSGVDQGAVSTPQPVWACNGSP